MAEDRNEDLSQVQKVLLLTFTIGLGLANFIFFFIHFGKIISKHSIIRYPSNSCYTRSCLSTRIWITLLKEAGALPEDFGYSMGNTMSPELDTQAEGLQFGDDIHWEDSENKGVETTNLSLISLHWPSIGHTILGFALLALIILIFRKTSIEFWKRMIRCMFPCCVLDCWRRAKSPRQRAEVVKPDLVTHNSHIFRPHPQELQEMNPARPMVQDSNLMGRGWLESPSGAATHSLHSWNSSMRGLYPSIRELEINTGIEQSNHPSAPNNPELAYLARKYATSSSEMMKSQNDLQYTLPGTSFANQTVQKEPKEQPKEVSWAQQALEMEQKSRQKEAKK